MGLTRRRFAALGAALPAATAAVSPQASDLEAFLRLSAALTGYPEAELDTGFAGDLLGALTASGHGDRVQALMRGQDLGDRSGLEADIVSAWYSGLLPAAAGPVVATVRGALAWRTLSFASAPGSCTGGRAWSEPPQDAAP